MTYDRKDSHYARAKQAGYRARSAIKLRELDRRFRLLRRGDRVVDLGAWPGGWLQVVSERIGTEGRVVGIDLRPIEPLAHPAVILLTADVRDPETIERARDLLGAPASLLLSDMAPKLTGVRATDDARCAELATVAVDAAMSLLAPEGRLVMKLFTNADQQNLLARLRRAFETVKATRPEAVRRGSAELYVFAGGLRPGCG